MPHKLDRFINTNGKISRADIERAKKNNEKLGRTVQTVGLAGIISFNAHTHHIHNQAEEIGKVEQISSSEHTVKIEKQVDTQVKDYVFSKDTYGKQYYENDKPLIGSVESSTSDKIENTAIRPVESENVKKIETVGVKKGEFDPYVTYNLKKNSPVYVPDAGKVTSKTKDTVTIKTKKRGVTRYAEIKGVTSKVKVNSTVKQGEELGQSINGKVQFAIANKEDGGKLYEYIHPNLVVDIEKSDKLDYKNIKVGSVKEKTDDKITSSRYNVTKEEIKVIKELPYGDQILESAKKHNVDPKLIAGVIKQESSFDPKAVSPVGAQGLMQLMPTTAKSLKVEDPFDPVENIEGGTKLIAELDNQYKGNVRLVVHAYNGGPTKVDDWIDEGIKPEDFPNKENREYGPKVLENAQSFKEEAKELESKEEVTEQEVKKQEEIQEHYHERNLAAIEELGEHTQDKAREWYQYCLDNNINILITDGMRTLEQQKEYLRTGKSKTLRSYHLVGQALDFTPVVDGKLNWNAYGNEDIKKAIAKARELGFIWGADWDNDGSSADESFIDSPHLQYNYKGYGTDTLDTDNNEEAQKQDGSNDKQSEETPKKDSKVVNIKDYQKTEKQSKKDEKETDEKKSDSASDEKSPEEQKVEKPIENEETKQDQKVEQPTEKEESTSSESEQKTENEETSSSESEEQKTEKEETSSESEEQKTEKEETPEKEKTESEKDTTESETEPKNDKEEKSEEKTDSPFVFPFFNLK
ncbi:transglycosylase SLT domain-containing protein [[Brevibacterium] frigoritolerans]|nr:transglycosylase SLT domain-containing protein [Peribacillus frigoritolerans]